MVTDLALSVVIPCRNEARTIQAVLADLEAQDFTEPFEVVVADGCSDDGTRAVLAAATGHRFALRVIDNPDRTIPHALNRAVAAARGPLIIRIDGHCRLERGYLSRLVAGLRGGAEVVGPRILQVPGGDTWTARTIALLLGTPMGTGGTPSRSRLTVPRRVEHTVMSCYHRRVWEAIGGYDQSLLSNEDFDFDYRAFRAGYTVLSLPEPEFRLLARADLGSLAQQRWRYGWWKAAVLWKAPRSLRLRQLLPLTALGVLGACLVQPAALVPIGGIYLVLSTISVLVATRKAGWPIVGIARAVALAPPIYAIIHVVWAMGLLAGLLLNRWRPAAVTAPAEPWGEDRPLALVPAPQRVAVVHDWIETCGGSETVLFEILRAFPGADLHAVVDFRDARCREALRGRPAVTTCIQRLPFARRRFRWYLPLMPVAIEQIDLSGYDLVISSSHAVAKGVLTGPGQVHVCYCHSPLRYAWDQQGSYLAQGVFGRGPFRIFSRLVLHYLRTWDFTSSARVDAFIANSRFVASRIRKYYRREAEVLHPPVPVDDFRADLPRGPHYLTVSRLVAYKRLDILIEAFHHLPERQLVVIGDGPERASLEAMAPPNVTFLGHLPTAEVRRHLGSARAFCFAGEEDFGIVTVEALASGTPVIAYGRGGTLDIIEPGITGVVFERQNPTAVVDAVRAFEAQRPAFDPLVIRERARRFDTERFRRRLRDLLQQAWRPDQLPDETA